jgi:hypothetical protein
VNLGGAISVAIAGNPSTDDGEQSRFDRATEVPTRFS